MPSAFAGWISRTSVDQGKSRRVALVGCRFVVVCRYGGIQRTWSCTARRFQKNCRGRGLTHLAVVLGMAGRNAQRLVLYRNV